MLYFRTDTTQAWLNSTMINSGGYNWTGSIPAQPVGTTIYYYVEAQSVSGKIQKRPMPAPQGFWKFSIILNVDIAETEKIKLQCKWML